ncbi:MAG TPA: hypothetical protein VFW44_20585 [Bryobacteraceae bacterium]|nr:hypothetical protein [Bryobacteraceae bacterium]
MFGQAAAAPSSTAPQKNWKDRAEYDLYDSITKDTNPKTRLEKLQQWEMKYPMTEWEKERRTALLTTYAAVNDGKNVFEEAKKILADDPNDFTAHYYEMLFTQPLYTANQNKDILDEGEKSAKAVIAGIEMPPPGVAADQWAKLRPQVEVLAYKNIGFIEMQRMNWADAETNLQKVLTMTPNDAAVDFQMGTAIASEKKVDRIPLALFYFARAATYSGQGELPAAGKQQALTYVQKQYKNFHGSDQDFDKLVAVAKANPTPPADFKIENANQIAQQAAQSEQDYNNSHPSEALWANLKMALTAADGENYFNMMKGSMVPTLKGHVIKLEPATKPKTILLAMEDKTNNTTMADATLKFEMPLPGKVDEGTELTFEGVADSYTASPFMLVFTVDKENLHGWTGKNEPAPVHHRPARPAAKKAE